MADSERELRSLQRRLKACHRCMNMAGPVVCGRPVRSSIYLVGQAPGPHEGVLGKPFAWTAGKTLFRWFATLGVDEERFRSAVYMAAVGRCFPGKAPGGGDRRPDAEEIARCRVFLQEEVRILRPRLIIPVGSMAIEQILGRKVPLAEVVGAPLSVELCGYRCDAICLPHPSGASTWHRTEPGIHLLQRALEELGSHAAWRATFGHAARTVATWPPS